MEMTRQQKLNEFHNILIDPNRSNYDKEIAGKIYKELMEDLKMLDERDRKSADFKKALENSKFEIMPKGANPDYIHMKEIIVVKYNGFLHENKLNELKMAIQKGIQEGIILIDSKTDLGIIRSINGVDVEIKVI